MLLQFTARPIIGVADIAPVPIILDNCMWYIQHRTVLTIFAIISILHTVITAQVVTLSGDRETSSSSIHHQSLLACNMHLTESTG